MADRGALKISHTIFRWARESAGLSLEIAAKRIGVKPTRLQEWEDIQALPTSRQLENAADAYRRPVATFFLAVPPAEPPLPIDFRAATDAKHDLSPETRLAIRRARWLKSIYAELMEGSANVTEIPRLEHGKPESIAEAIRGWFASALKEVSGKQPSEALRVWRHAIESEGLLVFQFPMPTDEAHAFSLADDIPTIVLNSGDAYTRRIFSAVHELAHLILREPGLCNPSESITTQRLGDVEIRCNAAAGMALVPDAALLNHAAVARLRRRVDVLEILDPIARTFAVSREVVLRRLLELDLVSLSTFRRAMKELQHEFAERQLLKKKSKVIVKPSTKAVARLGRKFVTEALAAHERGAISDSDLSEYLGVRLQHLEKIQELVGVE